MCHPFLRRGLRIRNKSRPIFLRNWVFTLNFQTLLAHLCVNYSYHIWYQKEEEKLNSMIIQMTNCESLNTLKKSSWDSRFPFFVGRTAFGPIKFVGSLPHAAKTHYTINDSEVDPLMYHISIIHLQIIQPPPYPTPIPPKNHLYCH